MSAKSRTFLVAIIKSRARAIAAIWQSAGATGRPAARREAATSAYSHAAALSKGSIRSSNSSCRIASIARASASRRRPAGRTATPYRLRLAYCREIQILRLTTRDPTFHHRVWRRAQQLGYHVRVQQHGHLLEFSRRKAARALVPAGAVQGPRRQAARFGRVWQPRDCVYAVCPRRHRAGSVALLPPWTARCRQPAHATGFSPRRRDCGW